LMWRVST